MKKLNQVLNFLRIYLVRTWKIHRHACIAVAAGTALIFTGTAVVCSRNSDAEGKAEVYERSTQEGNTAQKEAVSSDDEDPDPLIPLGYQGIIHGVLSSKGLKNNFRVLGVSYEMVLVGQRMIKTEVVSRLDVGSRLLQSVNALDNQSWELAGTTRMSDKDYENLLAIVEAEAGG